MPLFHGFAFRSGDTSREVQAVALFANAHRIPRRFFRRAADVPEGWLPVGNVRWCTAILEREVVPNYYPEFLSGFLHRKVWRSDGWTVGSPVFVKPADEFKRFAGFTTDGTHRRLKRGPFWVSEVVHLRTSGAITSQTGAWWRPVESMDVDVSEPCLLVPKICRQIRVIEVPAGRLPFDHHHVIRPKAGHTLSEIKALLLAPEATAWMAQNASPIENGFFQLRTRIFRTLPVPGEVRSSSA